jgi:hypothetical protein
MDDQTQQVMDTLAGRDSEELARRGNLTWYQRWDALAEKVLNITKDRKQTGKILRHAYDLIEECRGHQKAHIAHSSGKSLNQVIRERKLE